MGAEELGREQYVNQSASLGASGQLAVAGREGAAYVLPKKCSLALSIALHPGQ